MIQINWRDSDMPSTMGHTQNTLQGSQPGETITTTGDAAAHSSTRKGPPQTTSLSTAGKVAIAVVVPVTVIVGLVTLLFLVRRRRQQRLGTTNTHSTASIHEIDYSKARVVPELDDDPYGLVVKGVQELDGQRLHEADANRY
jgi:hypothetical protein